MNISRSYHKNILFTALLFAVLNGCAAYTLDQAQTNLRTDFSNADFESASALLEKMDRENVYKEKDAVLLNLERGMIHHFSGEYEKSNQFLTKAENAIEENFTKSITRGVQSMILSDNSLVYAGEDYEDVYINVFKSLNFIHQNDYESALVEARRIAFKLEGIEVRNRGLAEMFAGADSLNKADWKTGDRIVENSALGHYLSAVLFAKTNRPDNARIESERMNRAFIDQSKAFDFTPPPAHEMNKIRNPDEYNLLITGFSGRAPVKQQNDVRLFVGEMNTYLKFSLPSLHTYRSSVSRVEVVVGDTLRIPTYVIEEMDKVAADVYRVKEPIIYARAFTRSALKAVGSRAVTNRIYKENEALGMLAWLLSTIGSEVSEKADLRGWQTLPGKAHVNVAKLPPGLHDIRIEYFSNQNRLLFTENQTIEIFPGNDLALIESLYWN